MRRTILLVMAGIVACGSGPDASDPLEFDHAGSKPVTACADATEDDAFILALRYQSSITFNHRLAGDYAWALSSARATYPELCTPRAFADMAPDVVVVRPKDERISSAWMEGTVTTGIADIDDVLETVGVAAIAASERGNGFQLTLAQPVNARALARTLTATHYVDAQANAIDARGDFFYDGREYVTRTPSDITVKSGSEATRIVFNLENGKGRRSVTVQHNGLVGALEGR